MGFDSMVGAARVLHSENVSELMEAMAEDARDARARRDVVERNHSPTIRKPAKEGVGDDSAFLAHEDGGERQRTAA